MIFSRRKKKYLYITLGHLVQMRISLSFFLLLIYPIQYYSIPEMSERM